MSLLIWWTSQSDCREIGWPEEEGENTFPKGIPAYIRGEFASRYGRNGRGRLWIPREIDLHGIPWDDYTPAARRIVRESAAGIVFRAEHLEAVIGLPGFVTDLDLNIVARSLA